jgi:hypothetical protein
VKLLKRIFDFYLDASVHVALAVYSFMEITAFMYGIRLNQHLSYFVFFGTIACYNFVKYGIEAEKYILVSNKYHKKIQLFSIVCVLFSCFHAFYLKVDSLFILAILVVITGLYALPVLPQTKNLRSLGGLKIFLVAIVWAGVTSVLPLTEIEKVLKWDDWVEVSQRILVVLVLLIPFEIRDLSYDKPDLKTIPQRIGVAKTKIFGNFLVLLFFFLSFLKDQLLELELLSKGTLFLVLGGLMFVTKDKQSKYFASFWVESIPIFWWLTILAMNSCF